MTQLTPPAPVTVPDPALASAPGPVTLTLNVVVNVATVVEGCETTAPTLQLVPVPTQPPDQLTNAFAPTAGTSLSVTEVPWVTTTLQAPLATPLLMVQLRPPVPVTVPEPAPAIDPCPAT